MSDRLAERHGSAGTSPSQSPSVIPLCEPSLGGNEWRYVKDCLDTGWVSSVGQYVDRFEQLVAEFTGAKYAIATVNGTAALHVALRLAGVEPGDEVLVSTLTFIASANAIRYLGAHPVFIDAEPQHWQIDPNLVEDFLSLHCEWRDGTLRNRTTGRRVKAIEPVHILGHPVELAPILSLAEKYELAVVEDAAEGLGTRYQDQHVGTFGQLGCLSFNGNKLITTGGGGMILTNDEQLARAAKHLTTQAKADPLEYLHDEVGFNYRLPNLLAAVGCAQVEQLPQIIARKQATATFYNQSLGSVPGLSLFQPSQSAGCTWWLYTVRIDASPYGETARELRNRLQAAGIQSRPLWLPMHNNLAHQDEFCLSRGVAEKLANECLSLPCSVHITPEQLNRVVATVRSRALLAA